MIKALSKKQETVTREHVDASVVKLRNEFDRVLTASHYAVLDNVLGEAPTDDAKTRMELYQIRALLEYENGDRWNEVHPLVRPLLERHRQRSQAELSTDLQT